MGRLQNNFKKTISLEALAESYGEQWKKAYIVIAPLTAKALPALRAMKITPGAEGIESLDDDSVNQIVTMLQTAFVSGKVVVDGELVDAEAADLEDLPMEVLNPIISAATGQVSPKA